MAVFLVALTDQEVKLGCWSLLGAYPTYAKAARERRAKLQLSTDALKIELDRLRSESDESPNRQIAA